MPLFYDWIPVELCHYITVFSNIYVVDLGVLDLGECCSHVLLIKLLSGEDVEQLLQLGCAAALAAAS